MDDNKSRKLIVGFKNKTSVITLSDIDDADFSEIIDELTNVFQEKYVCQIITKKDCLIFNPQELSFILVSDSKEIDISKIISKKQKNKKEKIITGKNDQEQNNNKKEEYKQNLIIKLNNES